MILTKQSKFKGYSSGDYESMCFAVTPGNYEKVNGAKPDKYTKNPFHNNRYCLYPNDLIPEGLNKEMEYEFEITVVAKAVKERIRNGRIF